MSQRLRWAAIGWSLLYLGGGIALSIFAISVVESGPWFSGAAPLLVEAVEASVLVAVFGLLTWLIGGRVLRLTPRDFGLVPVGQGARRLGAGFLLGLALAVLAMAIAVPLGHARWRGDGGSFGGWLGAVAVTGAIMVPAALAEELAFRGLPLLTLARGFGRGPSLAVLAVLFSVAHIDNPGVTGLAFCNIAVAGILLGIAFFAPGGLWTCTGVHLGWNLTLAALAAPVSGISLPIPMLDYAPGGPRWLTGGEFGPEGGVLALLCLTVGTLFLARRARPPSQAEGPA